MSQLLFGNKFGSLDKLAAYIYVILDTPSLFFATIFLLFLMFSYIFMTIQIRLFALRTIG